VTTIVAIIHNTNHVECEEFEQTYLPSLKLVGIELLTLLKQFLQKRD
jgi:hypothetical protein